MHYTGWLYEKARRQEVRLSVDRNEPFEFDRQRKVIAGWTRRRSRKGRRQRTLIIRPRSLWARGAGGVIPPNATLMFDVELLDVK